MKCRTLVLIPMAAILALTSIGWAHEPVKLTGYVVDVMCATDHTKDSPGDAAKFGAGHTKECALMTECTKTGYGILVDGKWYPFDENGNELAKAAFEKTQKKDNIKMTVEGKKHGDKILVERITEE